MSISEFKEVAKQAFPFETSCSQQVNEMLVLMAAGLLDGLCQSANQPINDSSFSKIRVFGITSKGEKLLRCINAGKGADFLMNELESQTMPFSHHLHLIKAKATAKAKATLPV